MNRRRLVTVPSAVLAALAALLLVPPSVTAGPAALLETDPVAASETDLADACPLSPEGTRAVVDGCAAVELVRSPEVLTDEALGALDAMVAELRPARPFTDARRHLERAGNQMLAVAATIADGGICAAATAYDGAAADLRSARRSMDAAVESLAAGLIDFDPRAADASDGDVTVGFLRMLGGRLGDVVDQGLSAGGDIDALCAAVAGDLAERALITEMDDAAGLIRLDTGRLVALTPSTGPRLHVGMPVTVRGSRFEDGSGVAVRIISHGRGLKVKPAQSCLTLRIAPVQAFEPYVTGSYQLHHPRGYADPSQVLQLERGMRLAAQELGCAHSTSDGLTLRYSMQIELYAGIVNTHDLAYDLDEGDEPVGLPSNAGSVGRIKTTVLVTACKQLANGQDICDPPTVQNVRWYDERLRARGHYSTAVYSQTTFDVKDNQVSGDFDSATVVATDLTDVPLGTGVEFVGEGYGISNGTSTRPQLVDVAQGQPFAIYEEDDFIPDDLILAQMEIVGVDHEAGLIWPRVQGTRNGSTFWYSSKLPRLVRDLVTVCPDDPDTWYRLPFYDGWPTWVVNTGNFGDPIHGHNESQPFAWDFNAAMHTDIAAARGGTVVWVVEDEHLNAADYPKDPNDPTKVDKAYKKLGNYIWILHADGTLATYNHLAQWGALVSEGDVVHRGQHIGEVGNTGYSSQPHLHFEGGLVTVDWHVQDPSVVKHASRFEAEVGTFDPSSLSFTFSEVDCFVPKSQDIVRSTQ